MLPQIDYSPFHYISFRNLFVVFFNFVYLYYSSTCFLDPFMKVLRSPGRWRMIPCSWAILLTYGSSMWSHVHTWIIVISTHSQFIRDFCSRTASTRFVVKPEGGQQSIFDVFLTEPSQWKTWGVERHQRGLNPHWQIEHCTQFMVISGHTQIIVIFAHKRFIIESNVYF